jgi:phosphocarrier protein
MSGARKIEVTTELKITRELQILNKAGIHARPAAMFVKLASRFKSDIFVEKDGEKVNGKSIMGLLMLAAGPGSRLMVEANGGDADQAVKEIEALIQAKFGEE